MIQFIYIYLHASGACDDRSGGINWHDYCSFVAAGERKHLTELCAGGRQKDCIE